LERRLVAILAADVVGYTALMGADEAGTLRRLMELRHDILEPLITEYHGRIVKLMGDGLLVEFASVVDSVDCAVAWQDNVGVHEAEGDEDKRFRFRIGINLGDVIVEGDDIHGDGVNIAARLEGLADPGGGRGLVFGIKKDREMFDRSTACFRRAIELDPDYADPYAGLGMVYMLDHQNRWSDTPETSLDEA